MIKEIKFKGLTASPSDYDAQEGDLAASMNLISDDGISLTPIFPPTKKLTLSTNERVILTHAVPGQTNYILLRNETSIYWLKQAETVGNTGAATKVADYSKVLDIAIVGNTLCVATNNGVQYLLWKDGGYIQLDNKPPFISIEFSSVIEGTLIDSETCKIPVRCAPGYNAERSGIAEKDELVTVSNMVLGLLGTAVSDKVMKKGYFYQPFFVRYAYRLYDGSYYWHSAPILMLPTILPPIVKYTDRNANLTSDPSGTVEATSTLNVSYFSLHYQILTDANATKLTDWSDLISGIDVFVSAPIYTYDPSKDLEWRPVTDSRSMLLELGEYNRIGGRPPVGISTDSTEADQTIPSEIFTGQYSLKNIENAPCIAHSMSTSQDSSFKMWNIRPHERFRENIKNTHAFYKIAEIKIDSIKKMANHERLEMTVTDLSNLVTLPTLPDDYRSHFPIVADNLFVFNSRLHLSSVSLSPAPPFPIRSAVQKNNPSGATSKYVSMTVWTRINGVRCHSQHIGTKEDDILFDPESGFPRYFFYPDSSAYKITFSFSNSSLKYTIDLTPHDFLNGAYFFNEDFAMNSVPVTGPEEIGDTPTSVSADSKIYVSDPNNPFRFPASSIITVGSGSVIALSAAVRALSQGQFGQFPLYVFTSEGVWALEVSGTGAYTARQPVTRDVCINREGITQIDTAVVFPTNRGLMLLSGATAQCISEELDSDMPFDIASLPLIEDILDSSAGSQASMTVETVDAPPLREMLESCQILYDYGEQRLIVFSTKFTTAYVYSLRSHRWGTVPTILNTIVPSYPSSLAITKNGELVSFSETDKAEIRPVLLLTRPLNLGLPDILKTIDTVIGRGMFKHGELHTVLFGSRDLINWHVVGTSINESLRAFSGTPYRVFRILLFGALKAGYSITGATVKFRPRLNNRPR